MEFQLRRQAKRLTRRIGPIRQKNTEPAYLQAGKEPAYRPGRHPIMNNEEYAVPAPTATAPAAATAAAALLPEPPSFSSGKYFFSHRLIPYK